MKSARLALLIVVPLLAGLFSVAEGKDANWDFLNYRWYNPYALLHGRLGLDMLVAGHATFYNPLLELPFYLLATHAPATVAGFAVAAVDGACFIPLFLIAERALPLVGERARLLVPATVALAGLTGGGALGQIGVVSWDMALGLLTLGSMATLIGRSGHALHAPPRDALRSLLFAGLLAGAAAGLKLTAAVFPFGIAVALFLASAPSWRDRAMRTIIFSLAGGCSIAVFGGYWMTTLYTAYGNPTLPYFNDLFHSPYAAGGNNRDATFLPGDLKTALLFPFLFTLNSRRVAEYDFRDTHIAAAFVMIAVAVAVGIMRRRHGGTANVDRRVAGFLALTFIVVFASWEHLFAIYRYIIPLEMLGAVIVAVAIFALPAPRHVLAWTIAGAMVLMGCFVQAGFNRRAWAGDYVEVRIPSTLPEDAMVLMTGMSPLGFIIPSLPSRVPVIRAGSYLATDDAFGPIMSQRIASHAGPFYVLYMAVEEGGAASALARYGLAIDTGSCAMVTSNVADPIPFCKVLRR